MPDRFTKFFGQTTKQIKKLRDTVNRLKKEKEKEKEEKKEKRKERKLITVKHKKIDEIVVHFSMLSIAKATILVIGLVVLANFFGQIADTILIFFISILFAAALDPTVDKLGEFKIPRAISVLIIFLILIITLGFFISQIIPLIATQLFEIGKGLSKFINTLGSGETTLPFGESIQGIINGILKQVDKEAIVGQFQGSLEALATHLQSLAGNTVGAILTIFNGIFNFVLVLILTFFLVVDEQGVDEFFLSLFPSKHGKYIIEKMEAVKHKIGHWLRGQMILMFLMFTLTLIGFLVLRIDYALTLAMMTGIAELIPVVGPIGAGIPAVLVAFNQSPWMVLWVLGLIILLQQIEGNVLVPLVMKKAVGLSPIIIILSMLIGFETLGILGTIIAIPVTTTLSIFVKDYASKEK